MKPLFMVIFALLAAGASAEIQIINGVKYECKDGMCTPVEDEDSMSFDFRTAIADVTPSPASGAASPRLAQGYMDARRFAAFIRGEEPGGSFAGMALWLAFIMAVVGGLAMNLTPCVLPMVPINLMVIGKSASRGAWYGAGIALAYGALGVAAAVFGMAFGEVQQSGWFNLAVAAVFVALALALFDVWFIDFSKWRRASGARGTRAGAAVAFLMGALSAVLAGACVAPVLISVLLLTADLVGKGNYAALALPFAMGLGMALPWPLAGAGMQVLPRPGAWMKHVNRAFGVVVLCFAAWYARLGFLAFAGGAASPVEDGPQAGGEVVNATPATFRQALEAAKRPVLVDCWATWCKNCAAMERGPMRSPEVRRALEGHSVIRLQAEDIRELKAIPEFSGVIGLPAFVVFP